MARFLFCAFFVAILSVPLFAFAQLFPGGPEQLVPVECADPAQCGTCEFVSLINNVIAFVIFFATILATIVIIYGGFRLVVSQGDVSAKTAAKGTIVNVLIGYAIVLASFLIIDTTLSLLLPEGSGVLNWRNIQCIRPTVSSENFNQRGIAGKDDVTDLALLDRQYEDGYTPSYVSGGIGTARACVAPSSGPCSISALQAAGFGSLASDAARIVGPESGCNATARSSTDTTTDGRSYSIGVWQINLAVHSMSCDGTTLNCPSAFVDAGTRNRYNVRQYRIVNNNLYNSCVAMASIAHCNHTKAAQLARASGDMGDWACSAKKCGIYTSRNNKCPLR